MNPSPKVSNKQTQKKQKQQQQQQTKKKETDIKIVTIAIWKRQPIFFRLVCSLESW